MLEVLRRSPVLRLEGNRQVTLKNVRPPAVLAFVKNAGLGFGIPYFHNGGQMHEYQPHFIVRLSTDLAFHLILETKGYDPLAEVKAAAARRWVAAVNADGTYGRWAYDIARNPHEVLPVIEAVAARK